VNGFQGSNQNNLSSFTSTKSSIETFLNTYKDKELLSQKNLELLEKKYEDSTQTGLSSYNKAIINIENTLHSYELKVTQAESNYDNALKNKDVTIKSLNNSILSAKNNLSKTQKEYSKLTITSPINGTVSSINLDENTEVTN
jgi:multidrug resistance efflux pump